MHCTARPKTDTVSQGRFRGGLGSLIHHLCQYPEQMLSTTDAELRGFVCAEGGSAADAMALAAARAFIGGGDQAEQFAQTIQRAIQLFNCSDGLQATLAGKPPTCSTTDTSAWLPHVHWLSLTNR